jgi:hypothetical protein
MFTSQFEKAREATDASNIRAAYAEIASAALTDPDTPQTATIKKSKLSMIGRVLQELKTLQECRLQAFSLRVILQ